MTAQQIVSTYYDAWKSRSGDFTGVPLADDFEFRGPVASFDSAAGFLEMAAHASALVTAFDVRYQFVDGDRVCSIVDWEMALPVGPMTAAEILEVRDGKLVRGELIYDAEELRAATAAAESAS
jgi:ketosteroid isomerase-like protein